MSTTCFQHATDCGINMTGKLALPLSESDGYLVMADILHPETLEPIIRAGTTMDAQLIALAAAEGVDYVVVYKHPPVLRNLEDHTASDILHEMLDRVEHTNGLEFCDSESMLTLLTAMVEELTARAARSVD